MFNASKNIKSLNEDIDINEHTEINEREAIQQIKRISGLITEIEPNLFVSGFVAVTDQAIEKFKFTLIINVSRNLPFPDKVPVQVKLLRIPVSNTPNENLNNYFINITRLIEMELRKPNGKVIVHCAMGVSRSITVILAYLMKVREKSLYDAFNYVKKLRSNALPNGCFWFQLLDFEHKLFNQLSITLVDDIDNGFIPDFLRTT